MRDADESGFDIDATVEGSLDLPTLPEPALTLRDLDRAIQIARARPPEVDFRPLDPGSYGIGLPGGEPTRVTTDAGVFEFSSDNFQLFSRGGDAFGAFCVNGDGGSAEGRGIAWMVQRPGMQRSSWWRRNSDRARSGASRNSWRRLTSLVNRASFRWEIGPA